MGHAHLVQRCLPQPQTVDARHRGRHGAVDDHRRHIVGDECVATLHQCRRQRGLAIAALSEQQRGAICGLYRRRVKRCHAALLQQCSQRRTGKNAGNVVIAASARFHEHIASVGDEIAGHAFIAHKEGAGPSFPKRTARAKPGRKLCRYGTETNRHIGNVLFTVLVHRLKGKGQWQWERGTPTQSVGTIVEMRRLRRYCHCRRLRTTGEGVSASLLGRRRTVGRVLSGEGLLCGPDSVNTTPSSIMRTVGFVQAFFRFGAAYPTSAPDSGGGGGGGGVDLHPPSDTIDGKCIYPTTRRREIQGAWVRQKKSFSLIYIGSSS